MAYQVISQNNTTTTLADENGNIIRVPARVSLATSTDYTIKKVNNSTATLEDGNGNIIRDVPCVAVLVGGEGGGGGAVSSVNGQTGDVVITGNDVLPDQTGQSGKFFTTDGTDASWSNKPLVNNSTVSTSLAILGAGNSYGYNTNVGYMTTTGYCSTVVGAEAGVYDFACAFGQGAKGQGRYAIAFGWKAKATQDYGIQIGPGTNSTPNSLSVALSATSNYTLLSSDGTIPTARLTKVNTTITLTAAGWSSNTQTVSVTGMTADGVVMVSPAPADQSAYTSAGILCTAQAAGSLTFTCDTVPSGDLSVNVVCL